MKITPEIVAAVEKMIAKDEAASASQYPENDVLNYAYLAGSLKGIFRSLKYFNTVEEWLATITE